MLFRSILSLYLSCLVIHHSFSGTIWLDWTRRRSGCTYRGTAPMLEVPNFDKIDEDDLN